MIIRQEICVGCGRCHPYCPTNAIHFQDLKSAVDQEVCYECGCCLRAEICPVEAIEDSPRSTITPGRCENISAIPTPPTLSRESRAGAPKNQKPTM